MHNRLLPRILDVVCLYILCVGLPQSVLQWKGLQLISIFIIAIDRPSMPYLLFGDTKLQKQTTTLQTCHIEKGSELQLV